MHKLFHSYYFLRQSYLPGVILRDVGYSVFLGATNGALFDNTWRVLNTPAYYCSWCRETLTAFVTRVFLPHCWISVGNRSRFMCKDPVVPTRKLTVFLFTSYVHKVVKISTKRTVILVFNHPRLWYYKLFNWFSSTLRVRIFVLNTSTVIPYLLLSSVRIIISVLSVCVLILRSVQHDF